MAGMTVIAQRYEPAAKLGTLRPHPRNPRRGDDDAVAGSIAANGFYGAVIAQEGTGYILAGHTRSRALAAAGATLCPVLWVECDEETALAILLADNRTAELAVWDEAALLSALGDLDDLSAVGFVPEDVDALMRQLDAMKLGELDAAHEWDQAGMPGYESEDRMGAYKTSVHFQTEEDANRFFEMINRPKARRWWWPESDGHKGLLSKSTVAGEVAE